MADSILSQFDQQITDDVVFIINDTKAEIDFQFPPKVTSDSKNANWKSVFLASWEPLKIYWGSEARKITFEAEWIATGNIFTPEKIGTQMRQIKEYFYKARIRGQYPLCTVKLYDIVPSKAPFRLMDFSTSFGDTIVRDGKKIYPLYSKSTFSLELATNVSGIPPDAKEPKIEVEGLPAINPSVSDGWF